ncbi:MAG: hypothetical protein U0930_20780 [Pirellulales bacterium]
MRLVILVLCLTALALAGCSPKSNRIAVNGTVSLKGKPLDEGIIEFVSAELKSGASIINGKYEIPQDQGLAPGEYKVLITAGDGRTPADSPDGIPGPTGANIVSKDRIPAEYNINSKQIVSVSNTSFTFNYDIP